MELFFVAIIEFNKFICPNCGKAYKWKGTLNCHLKYECGKEPEFGCYICNKKFHRRSNMQRHVLRHVCNNVLPSFKREQCNSIFCYDKSCQTK